ncbi:YihY/virulence factor BrkB family protein [Autumnicola psychrophila]|uniref:YihY/virulence factor BrkB family protein n=1 Tax=Autumnicola psychrophila TaxID=3075592 RepID=A0ABU3DWR2_9FLAO|nr:YihY/virulence factor BrkB family protein [Zunongwangia sp. F225]MDT0688078.1 YihY/virulence factor BrkB family protein [Zunongwangia sp. F225]
MSEHVREIKGVKSPTKIKGSGWKDIVLNVKDQIAEDNVSIVSAGVAFYAFLAVFPAILSLISIYGLAVSPEQIQNQLSQLSGMMPQEAFGILESQIENFMSTSGQTLGWGTALGILFSLWSANKGTKSLFIGVDIAYGTEEPRGFIKENALALLFTLGAVILVIISMALIVAYPVVVDMLGLPSGIETLIGWGRWLLLAGIVVFFLSLVYKYAPPRTTPAFKWVLPGALLATFLWLVASWGFSYYVSNFGSYGEVYGSISAVVVLLMWLFLTSFIILLGAELNSETEKHVRKKGFSDKKK